MPRSAFERLPAALDRPFLNDDVAPDLGDFVADPRESLAELLRAARPAEVRG